MLLKIDGLLIKAWGNLRQAQVRWGMEHGASAGSRQRAAGRGYHALGTEELGFGLEDEESRRQKNPSTRCKVRGEMLNKTHIIPCTLYLVPCTSTLDYWVL